MIYRVFSRSSVKLVPCNLLPRSSWLSYNSTSCTSHCSLAFQRSRDVGTCTVYQKRIRKTMIHNDDSRVVPRATYLRIVRNKRAIFVDVREHEKLVRSPFSSTRSGRNVATRGRIKRDTCFHTVEKGAGPLRISPEGLFA